MSVVMAWLAAGMLSAQTPPEALRESIAGIRYPPLAEQARIQGDVHLSAKSGAVTVLSGRPILAQTASEAAKVLDRILGAREHDMTFHFVFRDVTSGPSVPVTVKRGNAFERTILRMLGFKTEKVIYQCQDGTAAPNEVKVSGAAIEIWVYGRTFCAETQPATLTARR